MPEFYTITTPAIIEQQVKKSRFICWISPSTNKKNAEDLIAERSRLFTDARHNCFAFRLWTGNDMITRVNDAHEPAGSAGRPMLQALEARNMINVVTVVTRYFGGVKLGIGGLIRAYRGTVFAAIDVANLTPVYTTEIFKLVYQYNDLKFIESVLQRFNTKIIKKEFTNQIECLVELHTEEIDSFLKLVKEVTAGRVFVEKI